MSRRFAVLETQLVDGIEKQVIANVILADEWPGGVDITDLVPQPGKGWVQVSDGTFISPDATVSEPPPPSRIITRLAFMSRFTQEELVHLKLVSVVNPADPVEAQRLSAEVAVFHDQLFVADYVDLDDPRVTQYIQYLAYLGVLDADRATQIMTSPVRDSERPNGV